MPPNLSKEATEIIQFLKTSGVNIRSLAKALEIPEQRIYGWLNKGAQPKYEDIQAIKKHFNKEEKKASANDWTTLVLVRRVAEILAKLNGTTSIAEEQAIMKDAQTLASNDESSSSS